MSAIKRESGVMGDVCLPMPDQVTDTQSHPNPSRPSVPIYLYSASFPGTALSAQHFPGIPATACHNPEADQDSVSLSALLPLIPPSGRETLRKQASSRPVHVTLGWRLTQDPYPVFQTRHLLTQETHTAATDDTTHPSVIFRRPLSWAQSLVRNREKVSAPIRREAAIQAAAAAAAAQTTTHRCPFCTPAARHCQRAHNKPTLRHHHHHRVQNQSGASSNSRHCHRNQEHLSTLRRHAETVFTETGDTSELLRVTRLVQRMAQSRTRRAKDARQASEARGEEGMEDGQ